MRKTLLALSALTLLLPAPAWAVGTPATIDGYLAEAMDGTALPGLAAVVTHGDRVIRATGLGHDSTVSGAADA